MSNTNGENNGQMGTPPNGNNNSDGNNQGTPPSKTEDSSENALSNTQQSQMMEKIDGQNAKIPVHTHRKLVRVPLFVLYPNHRKSTCRCGWSSLPPVSSINYTLNGISLHIASAYFYQCPGNYPDHII